MARASSLDRTDRSRLTIIVEIVPAIAAEERREDARRARTQAKRMAEPVVRDHLRAPQMIGRMR